MKGQNLIIIVLRDDPNMGFSWFVKLENTHIEDECENHECQRLSHSFMSDTLVSIDQTLQNISDTIYCCLGTSRSTQLVSDGQAKPAVSSDQLTTGCLNHVEIEDSE